MPSWEVPPENQPLVGVIDTGFSGNNPDLDYSKITSGYDWVAGDENSFLASGEGNEHGTHVLGIIAAQQDNGIGIEGLNDDAPIWVGRAIGSGEWADSLVEFVEHYRETNQPNAVVNLSLDLTQVNPDGSVTTRYELTPAERAAIDYARQHEIILVVAAGNDGGVMSALGQAAQEFDNIITVGAAERVTADFADAEAYSRADYSSYGQGLDILAPGGTADNPVLSTVGDTVGGMAGTSVAAARVTGSISKIWAANPDLNYQQIIDLVKSTATDLDRPNWDSATGAGLINLTAAISMARATTPETLTGIPATLIPETWSLDGIATPTERAAATPFMGKYYEWDRYTVRSGDTLSGIAQRTMGSSGSAYWNFIYNQNRGTISNPNLIYPGQVIWTPREVAAPTPNPTPTPTPTPTPNPNPSPGVPGQSRQYIIRRGDTLWGIAQRELGNGNRWREIMKTPTGGTFTDADAGKIQPNTSVYLPIRYETGAGTPVRSTLGNPSAGKFEISKITQTILSTIRSYAEESIPRILEAAATAGITDLGQLAYILATSEHESVAGKYMEELASGDAYEGRLDLGNTQPGDGRRYKGRGYVQITGRANYTRWANRLGVNLVGNPLLASTPAIAAQILVEGMRDGSFTSVGLSRYIDGSKRDFYNARRIVNSIDRASDIAKIAERYYAALINAQTSVSAPTPVTNIVLKPASQNLDFGRNNTWTTSNGYKFVFQGDGNLVLYSPTGKVLWATGTESMGANRLSIQTDGNVALYRDSTPLWATNTAGNPGATFAIQADGNLVVYSSSGQPLFNTGTHSGREVTRTASANWIRDRNLQRFPNLHFSTVQSVATGKALDAGGANGGVYPHPSLNSENSYHQWGFQKVGDHYLVISKATGLALDGGRSSGELPYTHPEPNVNNPYQLWKITKNGNGYQLVNKATGRVLDSGGSNGNSIYMHPNPIQGNPYHQWNLNLPPTVEDILNRFPGLIFSTVQSIATGKVLDSGGANNSVYPHPSPNPANSYHQWGFYPVGDHYMLINKANGNALDGGGQNGEMPYGYPNPQPTNNPYQLWKITKNGSGYQLVNKATGRALDSGGSNGNSLYMHPSPIAGNSFHQWNLSLPNGAPPGNDSWQHPLPGYPVTSEYGWRRDPKTGTRKFHYGIDIGTSGTTPPVKAARSGKVVFAGWNTEGYGNLVILEHPGGIRTYYAHLSRISVKPQQSIAGGTIIGNVGSTGYSTGNHLHLEVRVQPYRWKTDNRNPRDYIRF